MPLTATHYSLIIRELNALVTDVAIETEKHFLFVMTYNQCKMDKKSLIENVYNKIANNFCLSIIKTVTLHQIFKRNKNNDGNKKRNSSRKEALWITQLHPGGGLYLL